MKYFIEPNGTFALTIPTEWQYTNIVAGGTEKSPFSFQLYENPVGAFQISCYSEHEKPLNKRVTSQKFDTNNLQYIEGRLDEGGFNMHLWYAVVENYAIMAKYIYDTKNETEASIFSELKKAKDALATLELLSDDKKNKALQFDKYEKFIASLSASFDLKNKALENKAFIELLVIVANQIDAYLRMALLLKTQLDERTWRIDTKLLYQGENDPAITERKIYQRAFDSHIIDQGMYDKLEELYKERNKVIHRYIISELKTLYIYKIVLDYEIICESIRQKLKGIEDQQFSEQIGIYSDKRNSYEDPTQSDINMLFSQVNDKHSVREFYRSIEDI